MVQSIVDGLKKQMGDEVGLIHLNLLSPVGRKAARAFDVYIVPVTLLFDGGGELVMRKMGMPNEGKLVDGIIRQKQAV